MLFERFGRFGVPTVVVTDNRTNFTSRDFKEFVKINIINHITTPPFHPSSDGTAENAVRTLRNLY